MTDYTPSSNRRNRRTFIASLLAYVLLTSQLAPVAMAFNRSADRKTPPQTSAIELKKASEARPQERVDDSFAPVPVPLRVTAAGLVPIITASKVDSFPDPDMDGKVSPGQIITYNVTINNTGPDPAFNLTLNDTVDSNTTLIPGSAVSTPIASNDAYNVIGNVRIQPNAAQGLLANDINPNTGNNTGLTASGGTTSTQGGNVAINADGSFSYDPPVGFTGTDTFTYTATSASGMDTRTVTLTVAGMIFFVNDDDPTPAGDGRLTNPFNCLVGTGCFTDSTADEAGDNIFLLNGAYTGGLTLLANQKLIGQGAGDTLANIAGVGAVQPYSDPLPVNNGNPNNVTIQTAAAATNALSVSAGGIFLRGFTVGNTTGAKIFGNTFGTLTAGNSTTADLVLNGTGQALNLTTGTFAATSAFASVATTSSGTQGITLAGVTGTVAFGSTTVSGATTQGILIGTTTADINFGNTSVTGGTDAISLQNNSAGTRTFGTITTSGNSGVGFLHAVGGGAVNVTGATSITNPAGNGIDVDGSNANLSFVATTVNKNSTGGTGVDLTNNATRTIGFTSLTVTTTNGFSLNTNNSGTVNSGGGSLTQSGAGGGAASLTNTTLGLTFTSVSSNGGGNGLIISGGSGTFTSGTTNLQNNAGIGLLVSSSAVAANFGNTTVNSSAGDAVDLSANTGAITFADLDLTPDANLRGLDAANNTATITATSGTISTTNGSAINVSSSPLAMTFDSVSANISNVTAVAGVSLASATGTLTMNGGTITGGNASAFDVNSGTVNSTYKGSVTQNTSGQRVVNVTNTTGGTIAFDTGTITGGSVSTGVNINNANGNVSFANLNLGTSGARMTNQAVTITGGSGTKTLGTVSVFTTGAAQGIVATNSTGAISTTTGEVNSAGAAAVNIAGLSAGSRTPLNVQLTSVSANGGTFGIVLTNTNTSGSPGGFSVLGNTSGICGGQVTVNTVGTPATVTAPNTADCTGGTIQNITISGVQATNATNISLIRMNFVNANTADGGAAGGTCDLANVSTCNGAIDLTTVSSVTLSTIRISGAEEQGIVGSSVTGFSISNSTVQNAGNAAAENGVYFVNLFGTVSVTGSNFTGNAVTHLGALNDTAGTPLNMTVTGNVFSNNSSIGGDGVVLDTRIGTNSFVNVANNTFTANRDDHFNMVSSSTAVANLTVTANTLIGGHGNPTGQGIAVRVGGPFSGTFTLDINGNSVNGAIPTAINTGFGSTTPAGVFRSTIRNNLIGTSGSNLSGSAQGSCILVEANGFGNAGHASPAGTHTALVTGNTLRQCFDKGIDVLAVRDGDNNMNVTVSGNNVNELTNASSRQAVRLETGSSLLDETGNVCADILNNTLFAQTSGFEMSVRARSIATLRFPGYTGGTTDTAALVTYLQNRNPAGGQAEATVSGGSTFNNTSPAGSACAQPPLPTLPSSPVTVEADGTGGSQTLGASPRMTTPRSSNVTSRAFISSPQLRSLAAVAEIIPANRTASAARNSLGISSKRDGGSAFRYSVASVSAPLGQTQTRGSQDKQTKGGGGKPTTPSTTGNTPQQTGAPTKPAVQSPTPGVVVDPGLRYIPKPRPVAPPVGGGLPPVIVGNNLTWNVGTLPAGQSVTITFQVTVNTPPPTFTQVSNQGTVTADGGISVLTDDPAVGGMNDPTVTGVTVPPDLFVRDASVAEPASGSTSMIFTLALSTPAPAAGIVVNLSTANGTATGGTCLAGDDYESVSGGTATFASGEQIKTFPVTVCSDATSEGDETFFLNVDSAPGATIADGQGLGTITANVPGTTLISEMRTTGENGAGDSFVEIYNNTDTPHTVPAGGYGLFKRGADCDELPVLIGTIPATTVIPARGHYLFTGSSYSLVAYAASDATLTTDIESDFNVGLFTTVDPLAISTANRLDAVGFIGSAGGICDLLREGTALPQALGSTAQYSFVREFTLVSNDVPTPTDGNDNAADFTVVSTTPGVAVGSHLTPKLGAPGPENLAGPKLKKFSQVGAYLLDQTQSASGSRNRVRDLAVVPNGSLGTLSIRRRFTNTTGASITRLRFLIYDITTGPPPAGTADLRAMSSLNVSIAGVMDPTTCAANGTPGTPPCTVTALGTTLETPPAQPNGGGLNSSMAAGTVTMGTPLADGASISLQFLFGLQQTGSFRVFVFVEALP